MDECSEEFLSGQALKDNGYFYPTEADTAISVIAHIRNKCNTFIHVSVEQLSLRFVSR